MPFPPAIARALSAAWLSDEERTRLADLHFHDAGHGYDTFGLHPDFVALGVGMTSWLYDKWFRVRSVGVEHVPQSGPAILAANHSGNIPLDGAMIWMDVVRHTSPPRVPRAIADHFVPAMPWIGSFFARNGVVGGSAGNVRQLLSAGELLMIFPEGTPAIVKPWKERYKLHRFREGHAEFAIRHHCPVIPIGVVGAEEQMPQLARSRRLGELLGTGHLPIPAVPFPLPVRYHLYYGEPVNLHLEHAPEEADDPQTVRAAAAKVQAAVQALIERGLAERKGIFR